MNQALKKIKIIPLMSETFPAILLFIAALLGILAANSVWQPYYDLLKNTAFTVKLADFSLHQSLLDFVNDGLMTLFFLFVGLEIKREILIGELHHVQKALLPFIAALGGMMVPAALFMFFNGSYPHYWRGAGIPMATDIAFSLGILSLLGARIPASLKIFLTALAIIDDLGAILIIAFFYTAHLAWHYLIAALILLALLILANRCQYYWRWFYILVGLLLWYCILQSGVHATMAGVLLAFTIPLDTGKNKPSMLKNFEKNLHPWIQFAILPLFAFLNAGIVFSGFQLQTVIHPLALGIIFGLLLGKPLGITLFSGLAIKLNWAQLPQRVHWRHFIGMSFICGIGFTMSLFIALLAFGENFSPELNLAKLSIVLGSCLSGLCGYLILWFKPALVPRSDQ